MSGPLEQLPADIAALLAEEKPGVRLTAAHRAQLRADMQAAGWQSMAGRASASTPLKPGGRALLQGLVRHLPALTVGLGLGVGAGFVAGRKTAPARPGGARRRAVGIPDPSLAGGQGGASLLRHHPRFQKLSPAKPVPSFSQATGPSRRTAPPKQAAAAPAVPAPLAPAPTPEPSTPTTSHHAQLAAERALLERGRVALTRGDARGAEEAVEEHARRFPTGALSEEREALRIQVLIAAGKHRQAAEALGEFREQFPQSLLLPALDNEILGNP